MRINNEVKKKYRELINDGLPEAKELDLNYTIAISSGINVSQEIPDEAYKRAAWASNQGASFVELYLGGPAQIYNEWDNLLYISRQLGLSFDAHFPVQTAFDYANPNRGRREHMGFFKSHEFMYEFIQAWGELKNALESQEDVNGKQQHIYGINAHLVKSTVPELEERMAGDVSVDPFGDPMIKSRIWDNPVTRLGFFLDYLWEKELKTNFDTLQSIASNIEGFSDFNDIFKETIISHMDEKKYINNKILKQLSNLGNPEFMKKNLEYLIKKDRRSKETDIVDIPERQFEAIVNQMAVDQTINQNRKNEIINDFEENSPEEMFVENLRKDEQLEFVSRYYQRDSEILRQSAIRNIAGVDTDIPENIKDLYSHRDGASIAQNIPRFEPDLYRKSRWSEFIPIAVWERDEEKEMLTETKDYRREMDKIREKVKNKLKTTMVKKIASTNDYDGSRNVKDLSTNGGNGLTEGHVFFKDILNFRGGYFEDHLNRPSVIFWYILPWWMPFSDHSQVNYIWENINPDVVPGDIPVKKIYDTGDTSEIDEFKEDLQRKRRDRSFNGEEKKDVHYEQLVAAGAGAYVWGHFTQFIGRGQNKTLVEKLDEHDLTLDWEAHNTGNQGEGKLWKPKEVIKVCEAVNNTPVGPEGKEKPREVMYCTIDAEHLAMNGVDPLWVIDGNEERGYKGLESSDGYMITKQHITHPALSEQQHHHQPIRRGDTYVFNQIYALVDKGFCHRDDRPAILMYELGAEKAESVFMLRLMLHMIEMGITPDYLEGEKADEVWRKLDEGEDISLKEYMVLKFFGMTEEEWHHEWQEIFEHALDPLNGLLKSTQPDHTWTGTAALENDNRPEEWKKEEYQ